MALQLWDRLRATGLQDIAPALYDHGVRCVADITPNAAALISAGVASWKLEAVVRGKLEVELALPPGRADHPPVVPRKRASWALALEAAQPAKRQAALDALQTDIVSATARPSVDSRIKAWQELCRAWERPPFPLTPDTVLYFAAAIGHQLRTMGKPVGEEVRWAA